MSDNASSPENAGTAGTPSNHRPPPFDDESPPSSAASAYRRKKAKVKESVIDHTYRDYSQVQVASDEGEDKGKKGGNTNLNFPAKLHAILSNPGYQHIIRWMPHGRSWNIVDKYLLTTVILPHHFSHCKFESFNRSVNGWGFKRLLGDGPDKKTYYHECFLRGRPELTKLMQRLCNPGKRLPDKSGEPNFYEISMKFPLPDLSPNSDLYQDRNAPPKVMQSPKAPQSGQPVMFASPPPHQANGFMYGYPQPMPYPQMPTGGAGGPASQHPQQMFWPGQVSSSPYQPTPYGYYPYPPQPQMMMSPQAGQGPGYYVVQQPYQHPYFSPAAAGGMTSADAAAAGLAGMATVLQAGNNTGEPGVMMAGALKERDAEEAAAAHKTMWPGGMTTLVQEESDAKKSTDTAKDTEEPDEMKPVVQKECDAKESTDTDKNTTDLEGMKPPAQEESNAKESTDSAKHNEEAKEMKPVVKTESNAGEEEKEEKNAEDGDGGSVAV